MSIGGGQQAASFLIPEGPGSMKQISHDVIGLDRCVGFQITQH